MVDMKKKYEDLVEKAQLIRAVGLKLNSLIEGNISSIDWYREYLAKKVEENPDFDCQYTQEQIEELEKENHMLQEIDTIFWEKQMNDFSRSVLPF
jgi:hypothetical protein